MLLIEFQRFGFGKYCLLAKVRELIEEPWVSMIFGVVVYQEL